MLFNSAASTRRKVGAAAGVDGAAAAAAALAAPLPSPKVSFAASASAGGSVGTPKCHITDNADAVMVELANFRWGILNNARHGIHLVVDPRWDGAS